MPNHFVRSWNELHERHFAAGDPSALRELIERLTPVLRRRLRQSFRRAPDGVIEDAAHDTLVQYALSPGDVVPSSDRPLDRILYQVAWRNAADMLRSTARRQAREDSYMKRWGAASSASPDSGLLQALAREAEDQTKIRILRLASNQVERRALLCWLDGERRTKPLAIALEASHLSRSEQQRAVKRFKDRVLKRLVRSQISTGRAPDRKSVV